MEFGIQFQFCTKTTLDVFSRFRFGFVVVAGVVRGLQGVKD